MELVLCQRLMTSSCSDLTTLAVDLANPPLQLSVEELAEIWTYDQIRAVCPLPRGLEDYPELSLRVRGAFGRALHELPARMTTSGRVRARAWDVLFAPVAMMTPGLEVPRPAIVRADVKQGQLLIDVHVFGDAMAWSEDAALAILMALRGGIALSSVGGIRVAIEPHDVILSRRTGVPFPVAPKWAAMRLRTPTAVRHGGRSIDDPMAIARSCFRRVCAMARWQGVLIEPNLSALDGVDADGRDLQVFSWSRHSRRQRDRKIPMAGHLGRLVLTGALAPFSPWLALAATCNTGSHAGLGLGWFDLDSA